MTVSDGKRWYKWHTTEGVATEGADRTGTTGAGGDFLVAPLFAVPFLVSSTVTGVYSVRKGIENKKFWREYRYNTHRSPRYPYRVGYYDYVRDFGTSAMASGFAFKNLKKFR